MHANIGHVHDAILKSLTESPQRIGEVDFDLYDDDVNKELLNKLKTDSRLKQIDTSFGGLPVYKVGNTIFVEQDGRILYYVNWRDSHYRMLHGSVQVAVWKRVGTTELVRGLPAKIFFDYLYPRYNAIITDEAQSLKGENFWQDRMVEALRKGLRVLYLNLRDQTYAEMRDYSDIRSYVDIAYGESRAYKIHRFAIVKDLSSVRGTQLKTRP